MVSRDACSSRSLSWLVKSCLPNPQPESRRKKTFVSRGNTKSAPEGQKQTWPSLSSLPDDLLLECLSRVDSSSLSSTALVCRAWLHFVSSSAFYSFRLRHDLLRPTLYAVSVSGFGVLCASHRVQPSHHWKTSLFPTAAAAADDPVYPRLSNCRLAAVGPSIYILGCHGVVRYDAWTETMTAASPMLLPRKKFAAAAVAGKIYVSGGSRMASVEEYDPSTGTWRVISEAPRKRYGCIGAGTGGVFYSIGGLKIDCRSPRNQEGRMEAHVYASSMDLFDVETGGWMKTRNVPGGGCVIAACAADGFVYVLASHAVEISFWRFDGRKSAQGFGEWRRLKAPPIPMQVRFDGTVRFCCVGLGGRVALIQVAGCIDDLLRRSGRSQRGLKEGLVLVYDSGSGEWIRGPNLPEALNRAGCVCVEC